MTAPTEDEIVTDIIKEEILAKVEAIEKARPFLTRCSDANICSECGGRIEVSHDGHPWLASTTCDSCGRKGSKQV